MAPPSERPEVGPLDLEQRPGGWRTTAEVDQVASSSLTARSSTSWMKQISTMTTTADPS